MLLRLLETLGMALTFIGLAFFLYKSFFGTWPWQNGTSEKNTNNNNADDKQ